MGNVVYLLLGIGKPGKSRDLEKCHFLIRVLVDLIRLLVKIGGGCFPGNGKPAKCRDPEKCHFLNRVLVDLVRLLVKIGGGCFPGIGKSGTLTFPTRPCPSVLSFMSWPSVFQDVVP